jgi:hypothetical protein
MGIFEIAMLGGLGYLLTRKNKKDTIVITDDPEVAGQLGGMTPIGVGLTQDELDKGDYDTSEGNDDGWGGTDDLGDGSNVRVPYSAPSRPYNSTTFGGTFGSTSTTKDIKEVLEATQGKQSTREVKPVKGVKGSVGKPAVTFGAGSITRTSAKSKFNGGYTEFDGCDDDDSRARTGFDGVND